jgi:hypothetical protein
MRGLAAAWFAFSLCVTLSASPAVAADPRDLPESNLSLLDRGLTEAARTLIARAPIAPGSKLALKRLPEAPISALATRAVLAALTERRVEVWVVSGTASDSGVIPERALPDDATAPKMTFEELRARAAERRSPAAVFDPGTGTAPDGGPPDELDLPLLVVTVDEARVDYPRLFRSGLFGGLHVERRAIASLSAELRRPHTRAVYWVGEADTSLANHVLRSEVTLLEDASHPETHGTVPSQSWQKVIEPVLVVGLVVGLISLFYTNRP